MKEAIIKSVAAIVCVAIVCVSMASAVGKYNESALKAAEIKAAATPVAGTVSGDSSAAVTPDAGVVTPDAGTVTPDAGAVTPDAGAVTPDAGTATPDAGAAATKADVIKLFNEATAKAAKGNYKLSRSGKFIKNIDVGGATSAINTIIHGVDENASLDSVVGGFIGIKSEPITGTVAGGKGEGFDAKYMIKAMTLKEADVTSFSVNGDKYTIVIGNNTNPNANSSMARATNDYITFDEVNASIAEQVGNAIKVIPEDSKVNYKSIKFTATIVDGKMTALEYSYTFDATLALRLAIISATGTGEASITGKYTDIKY